MLKVAGLTFRYPHRSLFKDLSFSVARGELLHIKGPNGVGKSTLIHLLAGFLTPIAGDVSFFDDDVEVEDPRSHMEYLPSEGNALFLKMNAERNLSFWQELRQGHSQTTTVDAALALWGLDHPVLKSAFPVERYSTGMKRRLALARLTSTNVPLWLLDEPVYGLDAEALATFRRCLGDHLRKGGLAILVTHDESILEDLPSRALVLEKPK